MRSGESCAHAFRYVRKRHEHEDKAGTRIEIAQDHCQQQGDPDGDRFHQRQLQLVIHETRDLSRPFENPVQVVEGDEVKTSGARGRNRVRPAGNMVQNQMNAMHADQPVDNTHKTWQKDVQRRDYKLAFGEVGLTIQRNDFRDSRGKTEEVADPDVRKHG